MIDKSVSTLSEAIAGIHDGATIMIGGFGPAGQPTFLIDALIDQGARDLTIINNNAGNGEVGLAALLKATKTPPLTGVIGVMADKDAAGVLAALEGCFDQVYTVAPESPRALDADQLVMMASEHFRRVEAVRDLATALQKAQARGRGFCVCGSFYLAGQARRLLTRDGKYPALTDSL